jgi:hypothetical protein
MACFLYYRMDLSPSTASLLSTLDTMASGTLTRREDLGILLELGMQPERRRSLSELSFCAKFIHRAHAILRRIGSDGEGYERMAKEFGANVERAVALIRMLVEDAPQSVLDRFSSTYFVLSKEGIENLLALCHDLAWLKNWQIDTGNGRRGTS